MRSILRMGSGSVGVAREERVGLGIWGGGTVVTKSCLTRQAVSRPRRHGQQWALC